VSIKILLMVLEITLTGGKKEGMWLIGIYLVSKGGNGVD
jgi:hypothetical protein